MTNSYYDTVSQAGEVPFRVNPVIVKNTVKVKPKLKQEKYQWTANNQVYCPRNFVLFTCPEGSGVF